MFDKSITVGHTGANVTVQRSTPDGLIWITTQNAYQFHSIGLPDVDAVQLAWAILEANDWSLND